MGISSYLSNFALGITPEGILSPSYGGTGTTTGSGGGSGGGSSPTITSVTYVGDDTATNTAGGGTVTINGTNFNTGVTVLIGSVQVSQVTRVNSTQLTFTAPANSAGSYILYVVNTDGGVAVNVPGIQYSGVPTWTTSAGSLGTATTSVSFSTTLTATGDAPISYSVVSGALPTGLNLNSSTGVISGTAPTVSSSTLYNFTIRATDAQNQDTDRAFSLTVSTVPIQGQALFTTVGTTSWTAPANVTSICVVCIGGGGGDTGGAGGGGLGWKNNIPVTPGQNYTVVVGKGGDAFGGTGNGGDSYFINTATVAGLGGGGSGTGRNGAPGGHIGDGGGNGGRGGQGTPYGGCGGAGGYTGNGGDGAVSGYNNGVAGTGGGGGGGASNGSSFAGNGGGVGVYGQGSSGSGGISQQPASPQWSTGQGGSGSGGGSGGLYGGGGALSSFSGGGSPASNYGAVRIIWGPNRAFPSTNTADV
jgi:hypothetical protein